MQIDSLEEHLEDYLGRALVAQALAGHQPPAPGVRSRVRLSPDVEPWCVLDPVLSEELGVECYRPTREIRFDLGIDLDLERRSPQWSVPAAGPDCPEAPGLSADSACRSGAANTTDPDPATPDPAARLRSVLEDLGLDEPLTETLTDVALACATVATGEAPSVIGRGQGLLASIETLTATAGHLDAVLLSATRELTAVQGKVLLLDKDATCPEDLTTKQREKWRAQAKRVTRNELGVLIGWCPGEISDLVALANLPVAVTAPITHGLVTGEATWRLVRRFYRETSKFDTEDAAALANAFFGDDPGAAVTERLDSAGDWVGGPWRHSEFYRALDREVNKIKGRDPESTKKTRQDNLAANDTHVTFDEHGTAQVIIGCTGTQGAAVADRIERAARAARAGGDPRTLRELRVAVGIALLLHGTADMGGLPEDPALITVEQSAQLTKILHALPAAQLNVIVPLNTLIGTTPNGLSPVDADGKPVPAAFSQPRAAGSCTCECTCAATSIAAAAGRAPGNGSRGQDCPDPGSAGQDCPAPAAGAPSPSAGVPGPDCLSASLGESDGEIGVAEVIGRHSLFLTPDEVRTLALTPGSTLFRLLTDPATGTLIERSTTAYRFDRAMRAHIIAADVFCRVPGCLRPASLAQIDHVQEHGTPGGHTCVNNGQPLDEPHHDLKTKKLWDAVMHANRDVTWTTLLGRIYKTKAHDYRQYTKILIAATTDIDEAIASGEDPAAAVDAAIYQALSYRPAGATLEADDDDEWNELFTGWDLVTLTHTQDNGRRTYHPDPDITRSERQRHQDSDDQNRTTTDDSASGNERNAGQGQDDHDSGEQPDDDPTTGWTHDPDAPPPF